MPKDLFAACMPSISIKCYWISYVVVMTIIPKILIPTYNTNSQIMPINLTFIDQPLTRAIWSPTTKKASLTQAKDAFRFK